MATAVSSQFFRQISRWKRLSWTHPEWWSMGLCVAAWLAILWRGSQMSAGMPVSHRHIHHNMTAGPLNASAALPGEAWWWLVMVVAMMFPMVRESIRTTAARSLWRRRHRAIVGFLIGYVSPWMVFGVAASAAVSWIRTLPGLQPSLATALAFGVAVLWQVSPIKRRALLACHRSAPISPIGWRADRDCLRYGWTLGGACLISCWALMLACVFAEHSIPAMICATAVGWTERNTARPKQRFLCAAIAVLALTYAAVPNL